MGTVAQSLLAAMAGQLVTSAEAARTQARVIARVAPSSGSLRAPPTAAELAGLSVAELRAAGLASRRAATLARLVRGGDPERLRAADSDAVLAWTARERGLGPWSAGVIGLYGLGRADLGLVGDLGLVRLAGALSGRPADAEDTARLLAPYAPYQGLASLHLLHHPAAADRRGAGALMA
jgi:3-methyladenine DNA glycosylase/8-oxoguanine DNA glycosylase